MKTVLDCTKIAGMFLENQSDMYLPKHMSMVKKI